MTATAETGHPQPAGRLVFTALKRAALSSRFHVYAACTLLVVLTSYFLGKDMLWDTMYYHVYAGFSALHDRFHQDYFAAGPQGYFNPYAYVPFYLLIRSSLTPLADASILAVLQSGILWLTYELATALVPDEAPKTRVAIGVLAAVFAFANPILISEFGSSFIDVTTAEVALAGWLALVAAVRAPGAVKIALGALLLGAASALKPTNAVHAVAGGTLLLFLPGGWWRRLGYSGLFAACVASGFVLVNLPWSIHLVRHFDNPVFPLLNGLFRSPEFSTASILDYRFIPVSFAAALLRPFAITLPVPMIQYELAAPDLRYALLAVLALAVIGRWGLGGVRKRAVPAPSAQSLPSSRMLAALGCGFAVDWTLWLTVSGNGRYFIPMACVAGALCVGLVFRVLAAWPKARNYALASIFSLQLLGVYLGGSYRVHLPWIDGPWYSVAVPAKLAAQPNLYFMVGTQTNSFIIPDLPAGSGFINLGGNYLLMRNGPNGRRVEALIRRFAPHLRMIERNPRSDAAWHIHLPNRSSVNDVLEPFELKVRSGQCANIVVRGVPILYTMMVGHRGATDPPPSARHIEYLLTCSVVRAQSRADAPLPGQREADRAFDHLEDACPALFLPSRPGDRIAGGPRSGRYFSRIYSDTGVVAWITHGTVEFQKLIGGREERAGSERMWARGVPHVACSRSGSGFLRMLRPSP